MFPRAHKYLSISVVYIDKQTFTTICYYPLVSLGQNTLVKLPTVVRTHTIPTVNRTARSLCISIIIIVNACSCKLTFSIRLVETQRERHQHEKTEFRCHLTSTSSTELATAPDCSNPKRQLLNHIRRFSYGFPHHCVVYFNHQHYHEL